MNKLIVISGTPGVGKSTLAIKLAKKSHYQRIDLHDHYKTISTGYNHKKQCYNIDIKKLAQLITKLKKEQSLILDSHIAHLLPKKLVNTCIILTHSNLKKLEQRLKDRKYSKKKIRENLDAEIFQVCLQEAKEKKHNIITIDTSKRFTLKSILNQIVLR